MPDPRDFLPPPPWEGPPLPRFFLDIFVRQYKYTLLARVPREDAKWAVWGRADTLRGVLIEAHRIFRLDDKQLQELAAGLVIEAPPNRFNLKHLKVVTEFETGKGVRLEEWQT